MPKKGCRKWLRGLDIQQVGGRSAETCNQRLPRLRSRLLAPALSGSEPGARAGNFGVGSGSRAQTEFVLENPLVFESSTVLELGSGVGCVPSILLARLGVRKVYCTDKNVCLEKIHENLKRNLSNEELEKVEVKELDWNALSATQNWLSTLERLDFIVGSDIFFDPITFEPLIKTIRCIIDKFPEAKLIFSYQNRDSSWSIEYLLKQYKLEARLIRQVEREHSLQLGVIMAHSDHRFFAGVEGGATISRYYIFNEDGKTVQTNEADGLNCILVGVEGTGDRIANNMRILAKNAKINLPVRAMGMGLAGAESAEFNQKVVNYIKSEHNDIADTIYLTSDSVAAVAANFPLEKGGIVLICGTGSAARLLTPDHKVHCAGGWGHLISDGGSAYWIARRAIQQYFDLTDLLETSQFDLKPLESALFEHFNLTDKLQILDILYANENVKANVASFCERLAGLARQDPLAAESFAAAGDVLGKHVVALSRHLEPDHKRELNVLAIGSVFRSWDLLKSGFESALRAQSDVKVVKLFEPVHSAAFGAAVLATKQGQIQWNHEIEDVETLNKTLLDVIELS
ncbi:unnamed protein product [Bursaphelenchus xylophilus]|uniref:N-acetyl-D-glucosamine kinase n=1 Tax=Bursaphelenchus xylophilus TaxID=6326 RepID=A0A811KRN6_BURXY|nr:unnamed protein product [Bursaphelenchus xylophilus]CAG9102175.1 unnamed protein product [Bursaphelenchus xylophilus]